MLTNDQLSLLAACGWEIVCNTPLKICSTDGSATATGAAAVLVAQALEAQARDILEAEEAEASAQLVAFEAANDDGSRYRDNIIIPPNGDWTRLPHATAHFQALLSITPITAEEAERLPFPTFID